MSKLTLSEILNPWGALAEHKVMLALLEDRWLKMRAETAVPWGTTMAAHLKLVSSAAALTPAAPDNLSAFLSELSALSNRYGIAVSDGAELFEMESDDRLSSYGADAESRLTRA